ncbi:hypothetical protein ACSBR2_006909 [Camellia fascicularis]
MTLDIGHDLHLLYTLSGIQVLALFDKMHILDIDEVSNCILQHVVQWALKFSSMSILFFFTTLL